MNLETHILSEIALAQKDTYFMIPLRSNSKHARIHNSDRNLIRINLMCVGFSGKGYKELSGVTFYILFGDAITWAYNKVAKSTSILMRVL